MAVGFRAEYRSLNFVQTIRKALEIYKIADTIGRQSSDFMKNMDAYTDLFSLLIDCLLAFPSSAETEHLLLRLKFIIRRGFREFSKLYQINRDIIHDVSQKMKDNCNDIFEQNQGEFIERFVHRIDAKLMRRLFTKLEELVDYEALFKEYEQAYGNDSKEAVFFSEHHSSIQMAKAALLLPDGRKRQAMQCYITAFRHTCDIAYETSRSYKLDQVKETELNALFMKKQAMIKAVIALLKDFKEVPMARVHALTLSMHVRNIHAACEVYELIIQDTADPATKLQKIGDYADYCLEWGRFEKATSLLQWKLEQEQDSF